MARTTAMRVRMDMALSVNAADFTSIGDAAKKLEALKAAATEAGFVFTADVSAKVGSYDFGGDPAPAEPEAEKSKVG